MEGRKNNKTWDYFLVFMFLVTSGAVFWHGMSPALAFFVLLFISFLNVMINKNDLWKVNNKSSNFIIIVTLICILNTLYYGVHFKDNSEPAYIVVLIATYLIVSRYDFYYFRDILTNIVYIITLIGLIVFCLFELENLPTQLVATHSGTTYSMFLIYTLGWPNAFHRYTGIWHEAGACQIITNTILWLHYRNFVRWNWGKGQLKKIIVIILGSIFTFSTGSYMALMLLIIAVVLNVRIKSRYRYSMYLFIFIVAIIGIVTMFNSSVIQNKLFDADGEHVSKLSRLSDINALWKMTLERPILGYGLGSYDFWKISDVYGNVACSSGFLTYSASLGFTWMFVFVYYVWRALKRLDMGNGTFFLFITFILMQFNEKFIEYPITNMLLFYFASYNDSSRIVENNGNNHTVKY